MSVPDPLYWSKMELSERSRSGHQPERTLEELLIHYLFKVYDILTSQFFLNRFPTFCGTLVGSYTALQVLLREVVNLLAVHLRKKGWPMSIRARSVVTRFIAAFAASWFSLQILNGTREATLSKRSIGLPEILVHESIAEVDSAREIQSEQSRMQSLNLAGRSMDLTLFATTRALDTVVGELWSRHKQYRTARNKWTRAESMLSHFADAGVFAISAGAVMWAWFYIPERLPRAYNRWIGEAAQVDRRLVEALRRARWGEFVYGRDTGQAPLLQGMCRDYGWPLVWGDPAKTIPIPCEMVHMGTGPSCHWHAAVRFVRAFKFAMATYLPLQLLMKARKPSMRAIRRALIDAMRSSAFLGAFISLFYYGVCLSRTRLGPKLFGREKIAPMMWDQGLCVCAGCFLCGWSILIEAKKRRQEVAFFVAPRAASTILPRRYDSKVRNPYVLFWWEC